MSAVAFQQASEISNACKSNFQASFSVHRTLRVWQKPLVICDRWLTRCCQETPKFTNNLRKISRCRVRPCLQLFAHWVLFCVTWLFSSKFCRKPPIRIFVELFLHCICIGLAQEIALLIFKGGILQAFLFMCTTKNLPT